MLRGLSRGSEEASVVLFFPPSSDNSSVNLLCMEAGDLRGAGPPVLLTNSEFLLSVFLETGSILKVVAAFCHWQRPRLGSCP